jgi:chaperone required for assembly of F1-ATPase
VRDELFEEQERAFYSIEKGIRNFVFGSRVVLEQLHEVVMSQLQNSEAIYDFYNESVSNNNDYRAAQFYIANELYPQYVSRAFCLLCS